MISFAIESWAAPERRSTEGEKEKKKIMFCLAHNNVTSSVDEGQYGSSMKAEVNTKLFLARGGGHAERTHIRRDFCGKFRAWRCRLSSYHGQNSPDWAGWAHCSNSNTLRPDKDSGQPVTDVMDVFRDYAVRDFEGTEKEQ